MQAHGQYYITIMNTFLVLLQNFFQISGDWKLIRSLYFEFLLGRSTISSIIQEMCSALLETMKDEYMKVPTMEE